MTVSRRNLIKAGGVSAAIAGASFMASNASAASSSLAINDHYWFGDSIGTSWWSENPERDSPPGRLSLRLKAEGKHGIDNLSVGGMGVHDPVNPNKPQSAYNVLDATLPSGCGTLVIALGANDLPSHRMASELSGNPGNYASYTYYWMLEMCRVDALAQTRARKVVWQSILPVCAGGYCPEPLVAGMGRGLVQWYDVGPWNARAREVNAWMKIQFAGRFVDVTKAMRPDENGWADKLMMFDGLHPTKAGCTNIADEFPTSLFT